MIYVFLANGFEEVEALTPVDVLRRAGCEVKTVGVGGKEITGSHKICVKADMEVTDIEIDKAEMVVLPGGIPGTPNLETVRRCSRCRGTSGKERRLGGCHLCRSVHSRSSRPFEG